MKDLIDAMIYNSQLSKEAKLETLKDWAKDIQVSIDGSINQDYRNNYIYIVEKTAELTNKSISAKEFYDKRLKEDSTIGTVQLMDEYAKYNNKNNRLG